MHEETKSVLSTVIESNLQSIKNPSIKLALLEDPTLPIQLLKENQIEVESRINELGEILAKLEPFLVDIGNNIQDITDQNHIVAIYLLLSSIFYEWDSLLILAIDGKYSSAYTLLRKINEATDQVTLFIHDYTDGEDKNIKDWFSGIIIGNELSRKKMDTKMDNITDIDIKSLLSHLYQVESNSSHNGYASILELVSPFTEDFDHTGPTGFYRTLRLLSSPHPITDLIQSLRFFYLVVVPNQQYELDLENILKTWDPELGARKSSDSVKMKFPKQEK